MRTNIIKNEIMMGTYDGRFLDIYGDANKIDYQKKRYVDAISSFEKNYGECEVIIFSAPGRSEIGGNHTDHQNGEVLAAAVNLDTIAVVTNSEDDKIRVISDGYDEIVIPLDKLSLVEDEKGTSIALIKGVLSGMNERGFSLGGFDAYVTSDVLIGAGLSSSAAYETLIGAIVSGMFNEMKTSAVEIAIVGQYAENVYFGKPCGLMDQMACSVGNLVHVDFANPKNPVVEKIEFDMNKYGYSLCITDTKGSHADLTDEYAAVPKEMKAVAECFGRDVLLGVTQQEILNNIASVREKTGDRGVLRALHFITENERVRSQVQALRDGNINEFLKLVKESGDSSYKYLQNIYSCKDVSHQNMSLALLVSDLFLKDRGVSRVHGGGFAGTIQAFVKNEDVEEYKKYMDAVFGKGSCTDLKIRKYGGMKVIE